MLGHSPDERIGGPGNVTTGDPAGHRPPALGHGVTSVHPNFGAVLTMAGRALMAVNHLVIAP